MALEKSLYMDYEFIYTIHKNLGMSRVIVIRNLGILAT